MRRLLGSAGVGALLGGALWLTGSASLAAAGVLGALLVALFVPWRAALAQGPLARRAAHALAECAALLVGLSVFHLWTDPGLLLACFSYLFLGAVGLCGLTLGLGGAGQVVATLGALLFLALPYFARVALQWMDDATAMGAVLHAPLPILCGTFGEADLLRQGSLYRLFPISQSFPYAYPSPAFAVWLALQGAALGWTPVVVQALWRRWRARAEAGSPPTVAPALLVLAVLLFAPETAQAQALFPQPTPQKNATGDLVTRVRLGYYLPILEGEVKLDGQPDGLEGTAMSFNRHLDLEPVFIIPTFEVELSWDNAGRLYIQYLEHQWRGETQVTKNFQFEEQTLRSGTVITNRYRFRTIALGGAMDLPIADFIKAYILTVQRYVKYDLKVRGLPAFAGRNSLETFVPTIGAGVDILVWNIISAYGDFNWIDFRTSVLGGEDDRWEFKYVEWRAGLRLELVKHAHVMVEYYHLRLQVEDGGKERFDHKMAGFRIHVSVLF